MTRSKRIYVLDTNVLMHDPDRAVQVRGARRLPADDGAGGAGQREERHFRSLAQRAPGQPLPQRTDRNATASTTSPTASRWRARTACNCAAPTSVGRLRFQTANCRRGQALRRVMPDNHILGADPRAEGGANPGMPVVLVSKDINLRIKAAICGIAAEDYENDRALDDFSLLYTGATELPADFWSIARQGPQVVDREGPHVLRSRSAARTTTGIRTSSSTCPATTKSEMRVATRRRREGRAADRRRLSPATSTRCGASPRATASRISRSTR